MKNILFTRKGIPFIVFCLLSGLAIAQTSLTVGEVRNGAGVITYPLAAAAALKGGLSSTAAVSNLRIEWVGGKENKYYLIGNVEGDSISAKAITLETDGIKLLAIGGPGIQITCSGIDCAACDIMIIRWKPVCQCRTNSDPPKIGYCNMVVKLHIGL